MTLYIVEYQVDIISPWEGCSRPFHLFDASCNLNVVVMQVAFIASLLCLSLLLLGL